MYAQFRSHYPTASLTAELLQVQDGLFLVQAKVQVGETVLASAMASAETIEAAEDQAHSRVLQVLGLEVSAYETRAHLMPHGSNSLGAFPSQLGPGPSSSPKTEPLLQDSRDWDLDTSEAELVADPLPPPAKRSRGTTGRSQGASSRAPSNPASAEQRHNNGYQETTPRDISEVLAQIDVEVRRLNWTSQQAKDYLEKTYGKGKRSRSLLTDNEVFDLLERLQAEPSYLDEQEF